MTKCRTLSDSAQHPPVPERELKSVPLETGENNLAKALVGEELEATHLNEVWDYLWINMDGALKNKNHTECAHYFRCSRVYVFWS